MKKEQSFWSKFFYYGYKFSKFMSIVFRALIMIVVLKLFLLDSKENVSLFATILFLVAGFCYALLPFFAIGNDEVDV